MDSVVSFGEWLRLQLTEAELLDGDDYQLWPDLVPEWHISEANKRAVVYTVSPLTNTTGQGGVTVLERHLVTVRIVDQTVDYYYLSDDAQKIDTAIHQKAGQLPIGGWSVLSCVKQSPYQDMAVRGDVEIRQLGGIFRVVMQRA